jgi:DNA-binding transcriptional ArsR family regulator
LEAAVKDKVKVLKALGDETRLRIAALLLVKRELCVCEIMSAINMKQSAISKALRVLKEAGVISDTRRAQWIYYSMNKNTQNTGYLILRAAVAGKEGADMIRPDLGRLTSFNKTKCGRF